MGQAAQGSWEGEGNPGSLDFGELHKAGLCPCLAADKPALGLGAGCSEPEESPRVQLGCGVMENIPAFPGGLGLHPDPSARLGHSQNPARGSPAAAARSGGAGRPWIQELL